MLRLVAMYGALTVFFIWAGRIWRRPSFSSELWQNEFGVGCFMIFAMGTLSASFVMEFLKDKRRRLSALMLPATAFEKYLSRWFLYTFVFLLAYALAFVLADLTRAFISSLFDTGVTSIFPYGQLTNETMFPPFSVPDGGHSLASRSTLPSRVPMCWAVPCGRRMLSSRPRQP